VDQPGPRASAARPARQRLGHRSPARATARAGRRARQKADQLPGYRSLKDPGRTRARRRRLGRRPPTTCRCPGKSAFELLDALGTDGGVRHPAGARAPTSRSAPPTPGAVISRLGDLDFLAVSDFFLSETAELADVVLPSAMWAGGDGTMTNVEGRVIRRRKALDPPTGVPDDLQLLADAGRTARRRATVQRRPRDRSSRSCAGPAPAASPTTPGISYRRIDDEQGVFWPVPCAEPPRARPRLFADRFATPDGRARFLRVEHVDAHERPDAEYPYVLTTGRVMAQYQSGTQTRAPAACRWSRPTPRAELHPDLARRLGIGADDVLELTTRRGPRPLPRPRHRHDPARRRLRALPLGRRLRAPMRSPTPTPSTPVSKMPAFKVCAVAVARVDGPRRADPAAGRRRSPQPTAHQQPTTPEPRHPSRKRSTRVKSSPRFLQGVFPITGRGLAKPGPIDPAAEVHGARTGSRPGACTSAAATPPASWSTSCCCATASRCAGSRSGAKGDVHVPLRVVEDLTGGTVVELHAAAPEGVTGELVIDLGLVEV
jgi:assimilatory nitrate reductase catalytic subunit